MIFVIFGISLLNVSIGFGLAIYLGYGPPGLMEAWEAMCTDLPRSWQEMGSAGLPIMVAEKPRFELGTNIDAGPRFEADIVHAAADSIFTEQSPSVESNPAGVAGLDEPASGRQPTETGSDATAMEAELLDEIAQLHAMAEQPPAEMSEPSTVPVHAGE